MAVFFPPFPIVHRTVALDDVSATEWRRVDGGKLRAEQLLHSMMSVLPNGGNEIQQRVMQGNQLHSMMSVLPNGGQYHRRSAPLPPRRRRANFSRIVPRK